MFGFRFTLVYTHSLLSRKYWENTWAPLTIIMLSLNTCFILYLIHIILSWILHILSVGLRNDLKYLLLWRMYWRKSFLCIHRQQNTLSWNKILHRRKYTLPSQTEVYEEFNYRLSYNLPDFRKIYRRVVRLLIGGPFDGNRQ